MRTKIFGLMGAIIASLLLLGCPNPTTPKPDTVINILAITGITAPVYGATPVTAITETAQYTGTITWSGTPATFAATTAYTATITLTAKEGFTLTGVAANYFTVAGATATNPANSGVVTAVFPATGAAPDSVVNIAAIPGITAPTFGATPVTTIIETTQYTGTVTWSESPVTFAAGTAYTATIMLTAKAGFTLSGIAANYFTVAGATATNPANSGVVTAVFPATGTVSASVINIAAISGITLPTYGVTPATTITETAQYTGTVTWSGSPATFAASTVYTATITLTAKAGFTLSGIAANYFTVAGALIVSNNANSGVVTAVYPSTGAAPKSVINIAAITGVTAPVAGATPVTTIIETIQYTGTVAWSGSPATFAANTGYAATITLTAKAGFTLTGGAGNYFTVAGATATNPANSGVVTALFPATAKTINIASILGIAAPACGATPVTTITETAQYTGTITWSGSPAAFAANTVYTATITLTAKAGFTSWGVAPNYFTVAVATATNLGNSGVISAVFPATGNRDYTSPSIGTLKYVPAGRFQRDATATNISVITQPYRMSQCEITRAQFLAIMGVDPSDKAYSSGTTDPVQCTNWYHAIAFCNKLSVAEGLVPVYNVTVSGTPVNWSTLTYADIPTTSNANWNATTATWTNNGYRLPTDMEWMWAAMGAPADGQGGATNNTSYAKAFAGSTGSNAIGDYTWYYPNASGKTHPVGTKLFNELGLYDMSGNVYEWCWDWLGTSLSGEQTDYRGAVGGNLRVRRGGCWSNEAESCTVARTIGSTPYYESSSQYITNSNSGFRVVRP